MRKISSGTISLISGILSVVIVISFFFISVFQIFIVGITIPLGVITGISAMIRNEGRRSAIYGIILTVFGIAGVLLAYGLVM
ncbi:MAG: hypothetical protein FWG83_02030 [Oscillospiraceae bacterium]|nr:hypothetical protein [Oscillospiraceae bacterium]